MSDVIMREAIAPATFNEESRSVDVVASTDSLDGHGTIIRQEWDLRRFNKNPVVLYRHNLEAGFLDGITQADTLPIGSASNVRVTGAGLEMTLTFASAAVNELAERAFQGFKEGHLRAVSVGFRSRNRKYETHDGKEVLVLSDNELLEVSVVPIPSNADAVAREADYQRSPAATSGPQQTSKRNMDIEELKAEVTRLKADKAQMREEHEGEIRTLKDSLSAANAALADEAKKREEAESRAAQFEADSIKREVEGLVGKKISAAQVEPMIKLRTLDEKLFRESVDAMPDLNLDESVLPPERRDDATNSNKQESNTVTRLRSAAAGR